MTEDQGICNKARLVCLPCRAGKRQCDKLRPSCSRCKKYVYIAWNSIQQH